MSFLLESVEGGEARGRYSIIGLEPDLIWRANGGKAEINRSARAKPDAFAPLDEPPLPALRALIAESRIALPDSLPPMAAGVFGYLGYDMVRLMEELPPPNPDPIGIPDARAGAPDASIVVFDAVKDAITVVTPVRPEKGVDAKSALDARDRAAVGRGRCARPAARQVAGRIRRRPARGGAEIQHHARRIQGDGAASAKDYIAAGDAFQIVLAQRFEAPFTLPPFSLYRALRRTNPSPYLYFLDFGDFAVAGSSPEILVQACAATSSPSARSPARGRAGPTPHEDKALEAELLADPKERAEHLMLLDLGRNDVGRVARDRHASTSPISSSSSATAT